MIESLADWLIFKPFFIFVDFRWQSSTRKKAKSWRKNTINYTKLSMRIEKRYVGFPFVNVVSSVQLKAFSDTVIFWKNLHDYKFWQILIVLSFLEFTRPSDSARNESETTERLWPGNHICFPLWWQGNQAVILDARLPRFFGGKVIKPCNGEKMPRPWCSNHAIS